MRWLASVDLVIEAESETEAQEAMDKAVRVLTYDQQNGVVEGVAGVVRPRPYQVRRHTPGRAPTPAGGSGSDVSFSRGPVTRLSPIPNPVFGVVCGRVVASFGPGAPLTCYLPRGHKQCCEAIVECGSDEKSNV